MHLLLAGWGLLLAAGALAWLLSAVPRVASWVGYLGCAAGSVCGLISALTVLQSGAELPVFSIRWPMSIGADPVSFTLKLDPLSAFFLIPVSLVPLLAGLVGTELLAKHDRPRRIGVHWFLWNLLVVGMGVVVAASNVPMLLLAWETMSIAACLLIVWDDRRRESRTGAWVFLVATHIGTLFLIPCWVLLARHAGSLEFAVIDTLKSLSEFDASLIFVLGLIGFGIKAAFIPLHVWLPKAYSGAPSHVPAVLSGAMSKLGIYGLLRLLGFLPDVGSWWPGLIIGIGALTAAGGVLTALGQPTFRRILAYSSIENLGIVSLGLGVGLLGMSTHHLDLATIGLTGGLLHILNHSLFKSLLFLSCATVEASAGSSSVDRLGGLIKRMPVVGACTAIGCAAICGLPPLNGFAGEFLIYLSAFAEELELSPVGAIEALTVIGVLALAGGVSAVIFTLSFGTIFLGAPRTPEAENAPNAGWQSQVALVVLAGLCILVGVTSPFAIGVLQPAVMEILTGPLHGLANAAPSTVVPDAQSLLRWVITVTGCWAGFVLLLFVVRMWLLKGRIVRRSVTWGCGYAKPEARMQYTGSSFAMPLVEVFSAVVQLRWSKDLPRGLFPSTARLESRGFDPITQKGYVPLFRMIGRWLGQLKWLQHGRLQYYVMYVAVTVVLLLIWTFSLPD